MARFYMHLLESDEWLRDEEGDNFTSLEAVRAFALNVARGLIAEDARCGVLRLDSVIAVSDETNEVFRMTLADAVTISGG